MGPAELGLCLSDASATEKGCDHINVMEKRQTIIGAMVAVMTRCDAEQRFFSNIYPIRRSTVNGHLNVCLFFLNIKQKDELRLLTR